MTKHHHLHALSDFYAVLINDAKQVMYRCIHMVKQYPKNIVWLCGFIFIIGLFKIKPNIPVAPIAWHGKSLISCGMCGTSSSPVILLHTALWLVQNTKHENKNLLKISFTWIVTLSCQLARLWPHVWRPLLHPEQSMPCPPLPAADPRQQEGPPPPVRGHSRPVSPIPHQ